MKVFTSFIPCFFQCEGASFLAGSHRLPHGHNWERLETSERGAWLRTLSLAAATPKTPLKEKKLFFQRHSLGVSRLHYFITTLLYKACEIVNSLKIEFLQHFYPSCIFCCCCSVAWVESLLLEEKKTKTNQGIPFHRNFSVSLS